VIMRIGPVVGREAELQLVRSLVDNAAKEGGALVIRGEPGIGKSAIIAEAECSAHEAGMLVLKTAGVQSEARLSFAGLHQLVHPILGGAQALPERQRDALLGAFGIVDSVPGGTFLIGLAALELLTDEASRKPVLVIAEDLHWLDSATLEVLAFVGRRLASDPVVLLASSRPMSDDLFQMAGLPELSLEGLQPAAASELLDTHAPTLEQGTRVQLLEAARGNPLALIELPVAWKAVRPGRLFMDWLPLTASLEQAFAARTRELPYTTRQLLLVAALNDSENITETLLATSALAGSEMSGADLDPAARAHLIDIDSAGLRFRHPLVRSAVHQLASAAEREAAHRVLADVLVTEPDRSVWHRAASLTRPDEAVAAQLEEAASRALRRRGTAAAVAALERAAQLTPERSRRGGRLIRSAGLAFELGRHDVVDRLLSEAEMLELSSTQRGRIRWIREMVEDRIAEPERVGPIVQLAKDFEAAGEGKLALDILRIVATACWFSGSDQETRSLVVDAAKHAARGAGVSADDAKLLATLASADPVRHAAEVIDCVSKVAPSEIEDTETLRQYGVAINAIGHVDLGSDFATATIPRLRATGQVGLLTHSLSLQAIASLCLGRLDVAAAAVEEALNLAREIGQPRAQALLLIAAAHLAGSRGEPEAGAANLENAVLLLGTGVAVALRGWMQIARASIALGNGQFEEAFGYVCPVCNPADEIYHPVVCAWGLADFIEAAAQTGRKEELRKTVAPLERMTTEMPTSLLRAGLAYARPLAADDDAAEALFQRGLGSDLVNWPMHRARLEFGYGAWLRRQRRIADARPWLRTARDRFDSLGARPWAERARRELRAAGEKTSKRSEYARDQRTPQELQIAQMAAEGLTNREIGQQLYLSHRTVGSHLYRLFPKLGVTSRAELRTVIDTGT
jgi:DNA-binding CsgD family transcriptional regulator